MEVWVLDLQVVPFPCVIGLGQFFPGHIIDISTWQDYEVLYMVDPLDEICSQSIVDYEAMGVDAALDSSSVIVKWVFRKMGYDTE